MKCEDHVFLCCSSVVFLYYFFSMLQMLKLECTGKRLMEFHIIARLRRTKFEVNDYLQDFLTPPEDFQSSRRNRKILK